LVSFQSIGNVKDADFIGWGMWTKGTRELSGNSTLLDQVHYVAGRPTPPADITALMGAGGSYAYNLAGSTAPTQNGVVGTLNSATLSVDFNGSTSFQVQVNVTTSFNPSTPFTLSASGSSASFSSTDIRGQLIGSNAAFAGLTYSYNPNIGVITGALAFRKGVYTPSSPQ